MGPCGIALISPKIKHRDRIFVGGIENYEGKLLEVMEKDTIGDGDCLCLNRDHTGLGDIHHEDVLCFLPLIKRNGIIIPYGLGHLEQMNWIMTAMSYGIEKFNTKYVYYCAQKQEIINDIDEIRKNAL